MSGHPGNYVKVIGSLKGGFIRDKKPTLSNFSQVGPYPIKVTKIAIISLFYTHFQLFIVQSMAVYCIYGSMYHISDRPLETRSKILNLF